MIANIRYLVILFTTLQVILCEDSWKGRWFPNDPNEKSSEEVTENNSTTSSSTEWKGKWFPDKPMTSNETPHEDYQSYENDRIMGIKNSECDDGDVNIETDFDPKSVESFLMYTCLEPVLKPSYDVEPVLTIRKVPKLYTPVHKCMNVTITYDQLIPTLGYHRPLWAAFGEYEYLPPQRWLHNIEHGAIVALYHPCANKQMIEKLKQIVKGCLFKHIITPYRLSEKRPFALAAWGVSLEFSVFDRKSVLEFIKKYAKTGPERVSRDGQYKHLLKDSAKIISDVDDSEICPNTSLGTM